MTKFERVGVNLQYEAENKHEANRNFRYSCRVCCERGMRIECDRCAIAYTHDSTVAAFDTLNSKK
jgi:predicted DNA-binding ribbon-helix-helix protein